MSFTAKIEGVDFRIEREVYASGNEGGWIVVEPITGKRINRQGMTMKKYAIAEAELLIQHYGIDAIKRQIDAFNSREISRCQDMVVNESARAANRRRTSS